MRHLFYLNYFMCCTGIDRYNNVTEFFVSRLFLSFRFAFLIATVKFSHWMRSNSFARTPFVL